MTSGYSGTPLVKKLGIRERSTIHVLNPPCAYETIVTHIPPDVRYVKTVTSSVDLVHLFTRSANELSKLLIRWRHVVKPDVTIWISWPKKASKVPTDITEDVIREIALPMGYVDVKVCAVDETWSGLKLVIRKELR